MAPQAARAAARAAKASGVALAAMVAQLAMAAALAAAADGNRREAPAGAAVSDWEVGVGVPAAAGVAAPEVAGTWAAGGAAIPVAGT